MAEGLRSQLWFRVAGVCPRLSPHVRISRQHFRGQRWFVLEDVTQNKVHRFSPAAQHAVALMDGTHSVEQIWQALGTLGEQRPTQDELIHLLTQLDGADLLMTERRPDFNELSQRALRQSASNAWRRFASPLYIRLPLLDPDRFLAATLGFVRPLCSPFGLVVWLSFVGWAAVQAAQHWTELTHDLSDHVLARDNLLLLAVSFPLLKLLHELGHGYAAKLGGAEVHEAGVMTMVLMPVPYIDVSGSAGFPGKWHRALVAAAGMMVETFCAALAMIVWLNAEPGLLRAAAFNVMLIAGVSTLLFNGNPLLRFDAYYILSDLIEVPNLAQRSSRFYVYLSSHFLFGAESGLSPANAPGERSIFALYAPAAFLYRMWVMLSIALFIATKFHGVGAVLAVWTLASGVAWPLLRGAYTIAAGPSLQGHRTRAATVVGVGVAALASLLFLVPLPYGTVVQGVVAAPPGAEVHAGAAGRLDRLVVSEGQPVPAGVPLLHMTDPLAGRRVVLLGTQLAEMQLRLRAVETSDQVQAQTLRQQVAYFNSELADAQQRLDALDVASPADGIWLAQDTADLPGRELRRGELIGYVLNGAAAEVRAVVPQSEIELVRHDTAAITLRLASRPGRRWPVSAVLREVPTASRDLPSPVLATVGGGPIAVDPADDKHTRALEVVFEVDLALPPGAGSNRLGERVYVRFDHGTRTLGWRLARDVRQVFLRRFDL
jgi:putative peptide zinc metalloprotease protein